ncbi:Fc.00g065960.m01.CDS01 [Cosmosporella sp. VM-42]
MAKKKKAQPTSQVVQTLGSDSDIDRSLLENLESLNLDGGGSSENIKPKKKKGKDLVEQWNDYFQKGTINDHQRLCRDLGLDDDLPSKTQCVKALKAVNVNILQFLNCDNKPDGVILFPSHSALVGYTVNNGMFYPRKIIPKGSPLRTLLKVMIH